jgi:hypothetical protein
MAEQHEYAERMFPEPVDHGIAEVERIIPHRPPLKLRPTLRSPWCHGSSG